MNPEPDPARGADILSDQDLVLNFESLGDNCELGLVQRLAGAEPLGLLRFASTPVAALLPALRARFDGLADPANVALETGNGEYMIRLRNYDLVYHAHVKVGAADPEALYQQQTRILPFLVNKLIGVLESAEKILVFRQNEPLAANALIDLRAALARFGPSTLLWVQPARPGHPPGTVDLIDDALMVGYVRRLASRADVPDLDLGSWLATLRRAHFVWRNRPPHPRRPVTTVPAAIDIVFGAAGNARAYTGEGWSVPDTDHTWTIDDRSVLSFPPPADAEAYRLELDVRPFVSPPELPSQRLSVTVNGALIQVFDPIDAGVTECAVPGPLIRGRDGVEIVLEHPRAARPSDLNAGGDSRRLAVMFRRLTLAVPPDPSATAPTPGGPAPPGAVELLFGAAGNAGASTHYGWALPEADFTWAVDDRSLISIARPAEAANYQLEIEVIPFTAPPVLNAQRLDIMVNGEFVVSFDPLPAGVSSCLVPGRLINGRDHVDILLAHPRAARPKDLDAGPDTRRLAIMFRRLTLVRVAR
jgi:hypothetical protein